jgi:hypothetical protein
LLINTILPELHLVGLLYIPEFKPQHKVYPYENNKKANWIGHILCRNIVEWKKGGRLEVMGRQETSSYRMNLKRREDTGN